MCKRLEKIPYLVLHVRRRHDLWMKLRGGGGGGGESMEPLEACTAHRTASPLGRKTLSRNGDAPRSSSFRSPFTRLLLLLPLISNMTCPALGWWWRFSRIHDCEDQTRADVNVRPPRKVLFCQNSIFQTLNYCRITSLRSKMAMD